MVCQQLWLGDDALSSFCKQHCSCYTWYTSDEQKNLVILSLLWNKDYMWNMVLKATLRWGCWDDNVCIVCEDGCEGEWSVDL